VSENQNREYVIAALITLIKEERVRQKLSLNEIAARSGLSRTMVMRVEKRERMPTIDTLLRIGGALDVKLSTLVAQAEKAGRSSPPKRLIA